MGQRLLQLMRRCAAFAGRHVSPALLAAIGVTVVASIALFVPPYVGMADNGDFFRMLYGNGLYINQPDYDSQYLGYFIKDFGILQYYNENSSMILTSQSLLIRFSLLINRLLVDKHVFDVRVQAAVLTVLLAAAVYLLVEGLTWRISKTRGYVIAALAVFIFADTGYTAFFNSFFGEGMVYVMMLFLFASWLLLYRKRYNDYVLLGIFAASSLILTTSKQQNAPLGMIIACMAVFLIFLRRQRLFRILTAASIIGLFTAGVATYVLIPKEFVNINQYHAMTRGVLLDSPNPEKDLKTFGIDKQFAVLSDTIYYDPFATVGVDSALLEDQFYSKYGFGSVLTFYITHPDRLGSILNKAAKNAFTIRPQVLGNYEKAEGKGFQAKSEFFTAYSTIKRAAAPKTFGFIVIWILVAAGLYAPGFVSAVKARDPRLIQKMLLVLTTAGIGLAGIMVAIVGAGDADMAKHEFVFTVAFDLVTFLVISDTIGRGFSHSSVPEIGQPSRAPLHKGVTA